MDHQADGAGAPLAAQMVVEHEAVDGDNRSETPPAGVVVGIAAVAEGAGDVFEGTAAQPLCLHPPIPWVSLAHGYAASGAPGLLRAVLA